VLDYSQVKKLFADKLANDADGTGRFESAFYHTMKFVYEQGVHDGIDAAMDSTSANIGVDEKK
jgi:hypothetical protein